LGGKGYFGHWQTLGASCVFRALMGYEVKQHDFKMFEADS
jgi:hypothetical protein